jgi:hypothetical protein
MDMERPGGGGEGVKRGGEERKKQRGERLILGEKKKGEGLCMGQD